MSSKSDKKTSNIETIRHSLAHIMAAAVQELYPGVKFGIGPAIENGFYYDFDFSRVIASPPKAGEAISSTKQRDSSLPAAPQNDKISITPEDLPKIEEKMRELLKKELKFRHIEISKSEAKKQFKNQPYKLELIEELCKGSPRTKTVSLYKSGEFTDLCKGPHIKSTAEINPRAFKLTKIAGAYWKGTEKNPMLTRIYGLAFNTEKELKDHLKKLKQAEERDHRKLGRDLDIFSISETVGAGLILWHPKGAVIREIIEDFWKKEHKNRGYEYVYSPHIGRLGLWKKSGHWEFYRENLYSPIKIDQTQYLLKPMNCPFHVQIFKSQIRSYRDLPIRWCELGTVYRYEKAGVLHGLMRVRGFTQDDAHIFCTKEQLAEEIGEVLELALFMLKTFGFKNFEVDLSLRDPKDKKKYLGDDKLWEKAESALEYGLKQKKLKFQKAEGEAVFYGPKIDIKMLDSLGRAWQGPTIQVDFNFPEKFDLNFINQKGKKERVVMVHRTVLGSMERFIGVLLEHFSGALPVWLCPLQVWVIPVGSSHRKYAKEIAEKLKAEGLRVEAKTQAETVSKKIRAGELQKIPYLLVVGDKEIKAKSVRVRQRAKGDIGEIKLTKFLEKVKIEIEKRK